jgi:hypothetical protein
MWTKPHSISSVQLFWDVIERNEFFTIEEHVSARDSAVAPGASGDSSGGGGGLLQSVFSSIGRGLAGGRDGYVYRIVLRHPSTHAALVVAVGNAPGPIHDMYDFLCEHVLEQLASFNRDSPSEEASMWEFLCLKLDALAHQDAANYAAQSAVVGSGLLRADALVAASSRPAGSPVTMSSASAAFLTGGAVAMAAASPTAAAAASLSAVAAPQPSSLSLSASLSAPASLSASSSLSPSTAASATATTTTAAADSEWQPKVVQTWFKVFLSASRAPLLGVYSATMKRKGDRPGLIYTSCTHVCFFSSVQATRLEIPWEEVSDLQFRSSLADMTLHVHVGKLVLTFVLSCVERFEMQLILLTVWEDAVRAMVSVPATESPPASPMLDRNSGSSAGGGGSSGGGSGRRPRRRSGLRRNGEAGVTKSMITSQLRGMSLARKYGLPRDQHILDEALCTVYVGSTSFYDGTLHLFRQFVGFSTTVLESAPEFSRFSVLLRDVTELIPQHNGFECATPYRRYRFQFHSEDVFERLLDEILACWQNSKMSLPSSTWCGGDVVPRLSRFVPWSEEILLQQFPLNYEVAESARLADWRAYIACNGVGPEMVSTQFLRDLVRGGVPDELRGSVWLSLSGGVRHLLRNPGLYDRLLADHEDEVSQATKDIEKDIGRSLPDHPYYRALEGRDALRRVLVAYSWYNPGVGYTQSMNVLAALMLLYMNEEAAFWMLVLLCDHILIDYYVPTMIGILADSGAFQDILSLDLPDVSVLLDEFSLPATLFCLPWFMCLFVSFVPMGTALRIVDCFMLTRSRAFLMSVGLAIVQWSKRMLLAAEDHMEVLDLLKAPAPLADDIISLAFEKFVQVDDLILRERHTHHRRLILTEHDLPAVFGVARAQVAPPTAVSQAPSAAHLSHPTPAGVAVANAAAVGPSQRNADDLSSDDDAAVDSDGDGEDDREGEREGDDDKGAAGRSAAAMGAAGSRADDSGTDLHTSGAVDVDDEADRGTRIFSVLESMRAMFPEYEQNITRSLTRIGSVGDMGSASQHATAAETQARVLRELSEPPTTTPTASAGPMRSPPADRSPTVQIKVVRGSLFGADDDDDDGGGGGNLGIGSGPDSRRQAASDLMSALLGDSGASGGDSIGSVSSSRTRTVFRDDPENDDEVMRIFMKGKQ